jgi:DMSO/TMAO reductase YedYZ molybdopterin-dependent catalytic subunit
VSSTGAAFAADPDQGTPTATEVPTWAGVVCGLLAALGGLASAELLAGLWDRWRSPVVTVGDRVVDLVPAPVKDWAIRTFGTSDKVVLITCTLVILAIAASVVGVAAVRGRRRGAVAAVAVFAALGALASLGRGSSGIVAVVPSVVAGVVAAGLLVLLSDRARAMVVEPGAAGVVDDRVVSMRALQAGSRRRFLGVAAGVGVASVAVGGVGRWLQQQAAVTVERLKVVLPRPVSPAPPVPAAVSVGVEGVAPFITPTPDFYRIDTALVIPQVDSSDWSLSVTGYVDRPLTLTYADLLARPMIERAATIACVSNEVGGDLIGTAMWLGCRLDDLLAEAGIQSRADQVVGVSVDGFTAGFPTALLDGRDAMVVVAMNGEPLTSKHGFPARLIVPGVYGYVSATKWLREIRLSRFDEFEGYWIPRGWAAEAPIKTQSRIDGPRSGARLDAGSPTAIAGVAWAMLRAVTKVEVQVDDGAWQEAELGDEYADTTWRQWKLAWTPEPGDHTIRVRATDSDGATQTDLIADVAPDGATGWHAVNVSA